MAKSIEQLEGMNISANTDLARGGNIKKGGKNLFFRRDTGMPLLNSKTYLRVQASHADDNQRPINLIIGIGLFARNKPIATLVRMDRASI